MIIFASSQTNAHVLLETPQAAAGSFYKGVFRVPHGCHGQATTALKVEVPDGITGAKPMPKPGWTLNEAKNEKGVSTISWSGGNLPDDEYDEFVIAMHISNTLKPDSIAYFPSIQSCGETVMAWTDVPQAGQKAELKMPAARLRILAAEDGSDVVTVGSLEVAAPWLRATPGGAKVGGGYLRIINKGTESDRLIGASIPIAKTGAVHEMSMDNGTMRMRELPNGLEIKPGETVELKPGGYHLMFEGLSEPLKAGASIHGTLSFAKAGKVDVTFKVGGIGDEGAPMDMNHMHMH
ncbi:copper chaperone PCu(A)C [Methyloferula stellata]|uniref:copper chaperone PCu(A)C n=1 Tax=Methyloferula stellata TaxID=876270 RepID=UPI00035E062E|nr:copper chaperone PCu(A)C [Methyloferula stellata]